MNNNNLSPLELRLETINSLAHFEHQLLKCFYNGRSISENYLKTLNMIHVHGMFDGRGFCARYLNCNTNRVLKESQFPVFVGVGDKPKSFRPFTSIERLQPLDSCDVFRAYSSEIHTLPLSCDVTDSLVKLYFRVLNWKLRSLYLLLGIEAGQLINKIIESSPKVIDDFAYDDTKYSWGEFWRESENKKGSRTSPPLKPYKLCLFGSTLEILIEKDTNSPMQINDVVICPTEPLISAIQRVHMLYYHCGGKSGKETKDTKGTRDSYTDTRRVRAKSKKGNKPRQITPSQPEEVTPQTLPDHHRGDYNAKNTHLGSPEDV